MITDSKCGKLLSISSKMAPGSSTDFNELDLETLFQAGSAAANTDHALG